jgi:hypothetical protein
MVTWRLLINNNNAGFSQSECLDGETTVIIKINNKKSKYVVVDSVTDSEVNRSVELLILSLSDCCDELLVARREKGGLVNRLLLLYYLFTVLFFIDWKKWYRNNSDGFLFLTKENNATTSTVCTRRTNCENVKFTDYYC